LEKMFNSAQLKEFCKSLFIGADEEEIHCLYLTDDLRLITREKVCDGKLGKVALPIRKITRTVLDNNCSRLIITHNHPAGSCIPSRADIDSTKSIKDIYAKMDVELIDHIIVGRDGAMSMKENGYM